MGGRGTTKRKSEGDLLPPKKQARRAEQAESSHDEEEASDGLFLTQKSTKVKKITKPATKSRKSEPVRHLENSDDDEVEGGGALGSQEFLTFIAKKAEDRSKAAKATAEFKAQFSNNIEDDEKMLKRHAESLSRESTKRDADFLDSFQEAFMSSRPKTPPANDSTRGKSAPATMAFASLQQTSRQLLSNASTMIKEFEQVSELATNIELPDIIDVESWDYSTLGIQAVINLGRRAGVQRHEKMLAGDRSKLEFENLEDSKVAERFYPAKDYPPTKGWNGIAENVEKYNRRYLKTLPVRRVLDERGVD